MDSENLALLVDAVRAGDIEAAQALLPIDPVVKRAREICARHFGSASKFLSGEMDPFPSMGAVTEALRTTHSPVTAVTDDQIVRIARSVCYTVLGGTSYLEGSLDECYNMQQTVGAIQAALVGNPPVAPALSA